MNHGFYIHIEAFMGVISKMLTSNSCTYEEVVGVDLIKSCTKLLQGHQGSELKRFIPRRWSLPAGLFVLYVEETLCVQAGNAKESKTLITLTPNTTHINPQVLGGILCNRSRLKQNN